MLLVLTHSAAAMRCIRKSYQKGHFRQRRRYLLRNIEPSSILVGCQIILLVCRSFVSLKGYDHLFVLTQRIANVYYWQK